MGDGHAGGGGGEAQGLLQRDLLQLGAEEGTQEGVPRAGGVDDLVHGRAPGGVGRAVFLVAAAAPAAQTHHHPLRAVLPELFRDDGNQLRRGDHADLHRVGDDIREYGVQLLRQEMGGGLQNIRDAGGVLGRQGRDRAGGEYAVGGHGFDIGLNPGASAGIASGNGQCCFHAHFSFRCKHSTVL